MSRLRIVLCALPSLLLTVQGCATSAPPTHTTTEPAPLRSARPYLVSLSVANLDDSVKWYRETLEFVIVKQMDLPQYSLRIAFLALNDFQLELVEFKQSISYDSIQKQFPIVDDRAKVQGFGKLAFLVDHIDAVAARLKASHAHFVRDITNDEEMNVKWFMVTDNSGNAIQFFEKAK